MEIHIELEIIKEAAELMKNNTEDYKVIVDQCDIILRATRDIRKKVVDLCK